jgi:hypothetical protein
MLQLTIRLALVAAIAVGSLLVPAHDAQAGPLKAHLKQKILDKPAKKPKAPPPPKKHGHKHKGTNPQVCHDCD